MVTLRATPAKAMATRVADSEAELFSSREDKVDLADSRVVQCRVEASVVPAALRG